MSVVNDALRLDESKSDNAADHIRAQMNGLGRELYRTIAVFFAAAIAFGFVMGILYYRWISSPIDPAELSPAVQKPAQQPGAAIKSDPRKFSTK